MHFNIRIRVGFRVWMGILVLGTAGCDSGRDDVVGNGSDSGEQTSSDSGEMDPVLAPDFDPAPGSYLDQVDVTITTATPGARVYYTTDGSEPTSDSILYTGSIRVARVGATQLRAIAALDDQGYSPIREAEYTITPSYTTTPWAMTTTSAEGYSSMADVVSDSDGNAYAIGSIIGNVGGNTLAFGGQRFDSAGGSAAAFLTKIGPDGLVDWITGSREGRADAWFNAVTRSAEGELFVVGSQTGGDPIDYGNDLLVPTATDRYRHALLIKYDANGMAQWARTPLSVEANSTFLGVTVASDGSLYAVGEIGRGVYDFGTGPISGKSSSENIIIVKYNADGVAQWARTVDPISEAAQTVFEEVIALPDGGVVAVGRQAGDAVVVYGGKSLEGPPRLQFSGLVVRYSADGDTEWARLAVGEFGADLKSVALTAEGLVTVGFVDGEGTYFGADGIALNTEDGDGPVVIHYSDEGTPEWAVHAKSQVDDQLGLLHDVTVDARGQIHAAGYQWNDGDFDWDGVLAAGAVAQSGGTVLNGVVATLSADGEVLRVRTNDTNSQGRSEFFGVAADPAGNPLTVGVQVGPNPGGLGLSTSSYAGMTVGDGVPDLSDLLAVQWPE